LPDLPTTGFAAGAAGAAGGAVVEADDMAVEADDKEGQGLRNASVLYDCVTRLRNLITYWMMDSTES
jgi:hypothetical protein